MRPYFDTPNTDVPPEIQSLAGQPCYIERYIAELVELEFSLMARIERATKAHRARRYLLRYQRLSRAAEIAA